MKQVKTSSVLLIVLALIGVAFVFSGTYDIGANDPHYPFVHRTLETLRDRSIAVRAKAIQVPDLTDAALIRQGAGNYHAMCTGCHLMPGMPESEMHKGLYPQPPNLGELRVDPARAFWVLKNGIKASGMPSWGKSMSDRYLWGLVAFQQKLPDLSAEDYRALVASSGGHSHGGGETDTGGHSDQHGAGHSHDETAPHSDGEDQPPAHDESAPHSHGATVPTAAAQPTAADAKAPADVVAVVEHFQRLLVNGDTVHASELLDDSVKIFESGNIERSRDEYAAHHLKEDAAFLKTAEVRLLTRTGDAVGDLAWVGSESRIHSSGVAGKQAELISTETMVLRKRAEGWRIVHIHWSSRPDAVR